MLRTILIFLVGFGSAVSQGYAQYPQSSDGYTQQSDYPTYASGGQRGTGDSYGGSLLQEARTLAKNITSLQEKDNELVHRLIELIDLSEPTSLYTDKFFAELFPEVRERLAAQNEEITNLWTQANALNGLADNVAEIVAYLAEADHQLKDIAEQSKEIQETVGKLKQKDVDLDKRLGSVKYQLTAQEARLRTLVSGTSKAKDRLSYLRKQIKTVNEIVLDEREGGSFTITLTNKNPRVTVTTDYNGKKAPLVQYGITTLHIVNEKEESIIVHYPDYNYGSSSYGKTPANVPEQIFFDLDVLYDSGTKQLTAILFDHSTEGWSVAEVTTSIILINIDDRNIYIEKQASPPVAYKKY